MATKAQLDSLRALHPNWSEQQITAAGKQYDAMVTNIKQQEGIVGTKLPVPDITKAVPKAPVVPKLSQQEQLQLAAFVDPTNAQDLEEQIKAAAPKVDPTASITVGGSKSPGALSNGTSALGGSIGMPTYSGANYQADFFGGVANQTTGMLYTAQDKNGKTQIVRNDSAGQPHQVIISVNPADPTQYMVQDISEFDSILQQYLKTEGFDKLKSQLKNYYTNAKNYIGSTAPDDAFRRAFITSLLDNTAKNFYAAKSGATTLTPLADSLTASQGLAGRRENITSNVTPFANASIDLNSFMQENLGRQATTKETNDYYHILNKYELAHPDKSVVQTDKLGFEKNRVNYLGANAEDKAALKVSFLYKELTAKGINPDDISKTGGKIAQGMQELQAFASEYGLGHFDNAQALGTIIDASKATASKMTNADTLALMTNTLQPGGSIDQQKSRIKEQAKLTYKPLANFIDAGGNIKNVADQFGALNQKYLETYQPTDVFNPDIQKALQGDGKNIMSENDYVSLLKSKPEWAMTMNAREQAASFANTILKEFGLMG